MHPDAFHTSLRHAVETGAASWPSHAEIGIAGCEELFAAGLGLLTLLVKADEIDGQNITTTNKKITTLKLERRPDQINFASISISCFLFQCLF